MTALATGCVGVLKPQKVRRVRTGADEWQRLTAAAFAPAAPAGQDDEPAPWLPGVTYLLHFDKPFGHSRHYTGWTVNLPRRIKLHRRGRGARLLQLVVDAGITFDVARTWPDTARPWEAHLKRHGSARRHCPHPDCAGEAAWRRVHVPQRWPFLPEPELEESQA